MDNINTNKTKRRVKCLIKSLFQRNKFKKSKLIQNNIKKLHSYWNSRKKDILNKSIS